MVVANKVESIRRIWGWWQCLSPALGPRSLSVCGGGGGVNPLTRHTVTFGLPKLYLPQGSPATHFSTIPKERWTVGWPADRLAKQLWWRYCEAGAEKWTSIPSEPQPSQPSTILLCTRANNIEQSHYKAILTLFNHQTVVLQGSPRYFTDWQVPFMKVDKTKKRAFVVQYNTSITYINKLSYYITRKHAQIKV